MSARKKAAKKAAAKRKAAARLAVCPFCGGGEFVASADGRPVSKCSDCGRWSGDS